MCGIAGAWFEAGRGAARQAEGAAAAMTSALAHRGPDGQGVRLVTPHADVETAAVAFGHRRLAILDLSDRGAQPMRNAEGTVWITYNGEVYNFQQLRSQLEALGRTFHSSSDTEVVLQGYEAWGAGVVERLRGMFALAIWDGRRRELLLTRDRLGIKPLYIHRSKSHVLFASEIRALLATGLVPRALDPVAVDEYLTYQTVPPPRTLIAGVEMLAPGTLWRLPSDGRPVARSYWHMLDAAARRSEPVTAGSVRQGLRERLAEATRLHQISDVPVGLFLSGGIDSSALVALARESGTVPRTFTVVLPGSPLNEARFARSVAERFGAEHEEISLRGADLRDQVPDAVRGVDHPSADGFNSFVVAAAVRRAGIKVALSGLGGDELFGGYPSFQRLARLAPYSRAWKRSPAPVRSLAASAVRALGRDSIAAGKAAAVLESDATLSQAFPVMRQVFARTQRRELLTDQAVVETRGAIDPYVALLDEAAASYPGTDVMTMVSYAEARTYMHDVLLRDTDQMTMAHGLEARVPLLDHEVVEYVMSLPESAKAPQGRPKSLLVESLGAALPAECVDRPKQGFVLPFENWMRTDLRAFCEEQLGPAGLGATGLFREEGVSELWQRFMTGDPRTSWSRPWLLVALGAWASANGITA